MLLTRREVPPAPIADGSTNHGAWGCSLDSYVTSVTGVTDKHKYMILKSLYDCYIVRSSTLREVLQELRVLHVTSSGVIALTQA